MDYNALRIAAQENKQIEQVASRLLQSPRFVAAAFALWTKVEIVEICERAGKPLNNFEVTIIVQGAQITHAARWADEDGTTFLVTGGGAERFAPPKLR